jgi:PAS domain S-box-containing protein
MQGDKHWEEDFHKTEANLKSIIDNAATLYTLLDTELRIISFNEPAAQNVMQKTGKEMTVGSSIIDYVSGDRKKEINDRYQSVLNGKKHTYQISYQPNNESLTWYEVNLFPVFDDAQVNLGMVIAVNNITARKQEEAKLKKSDEKFQELLVNKTEEIKKSSVALQEIQNREKKLRSDLGKLLSDDLRSPLARIQGLISMLNDDHLEESSVKEIFESIASETKQMDKVMDEMNGVISVDDQIKPLKNPAVENTSSPITNILLLDDDEICNFVSRKTLSKTSFPSHVKSFQNGTQALAELKGLKANEFPDTMFVDINMPVMDGWQFLSELERFPSDVLEKCKIFMLSSTIDPNDIDRSKKSSIVKKLISKPLSVQVLEDLLNKSE